MKITDFGEIVEIMMYRKRIKLKDIANHIGASSVYTRQVIDGFQRGEKADVYRLQIADFLGIHHKYLKEKTHA